MQNSANETHYWKLEDILIIHSGKVSVLQYTVYSHVDLIISHYRYYTTLSRLDYYRRTLVEFLLPVLCLIMVVYGIIFLNYVPQYIIMAC